MSNFNYLIHSNSWNKWNIKINNLVTLSQLTICPCRTLYRVASCQQSNIPLHIFQNHCLLNKPVILLWTWWCGCACLCRWWCPVWFSPEVVPTFPTWHAWQEMSHPKEKVEWPRGDGREPERNRRGEGKGKRGERSSIKKRVCHFWASLVQPV